jgi:hypothetical protein
VLTRRLLSVLATAAIGVVGALAFASPASAHTVTVTGSAECKSDGKFTVTWTITNNFTSKGSVESVSPAIDGLSIGTEINAGDSLKVTQTGVEDNARHQVSLEVGMVWKQDNFHASDTGTADLVTDDCPSPSPSAPAPASAPVSLPASSPASGGGGGLPVTGAPTIAFAGVALVLIAGGTLLVLLGRRRRGAAQ